jgi:hypothetical protein
LERSIKYFWAISSFVLTSLLLIAWQSFFLSSKIFTFDFTIKGKIDERKIAFLRDVGSILERSLGKANRTKFGILPISEAVL